MLEKIIVKYECLKTVKKRHFNFRKKNVRKFEICTEFQQRNWTELGGILEGQFKLWKATKVAVQFEAVQGNFNDVMRGEFVDWLSNY